jgi:hypothetical protein
MIHHVPATQAGCDMQGAISMRTMTDRQLTQIAGGRINTGAELAAGLIMAGGAGMVGALLGAAGGPVGSAALGATFAKYGFKYVDYITR